MMARIEPRRISTLTWLSATSAPKRTLTPCTSRSGPGGLRSPGPLPGDDVMDSHVGTDRAGPAILVRHLRLHLHVPTLAVQRLDEGRVLLGDVSASHLARPGDLLVVRIQLLVEDQELSNPGPPEALVLGEAPVHPLHLPPDQVVDLRLL